MALPLHVRLSIPLGFTQIENSSASLPYFYGTDQSKAGMTTS